MSSIDIYTDGSHIKGTRIIGYGSYFEYKNVGYYLSGKVSPKLLLEYNIKANVSNPTAEFIAFAQTLRYLPDDMSGYKLIFKIDYIGINHWMTGTWKAKKDYIIKIRDYCIERLKTMQCKWKIDHVSAHTGVVGNEIADQLSKSQIEKNTFTDLFK